MTNHGEKIIPWEDRFSEDFIRLSMEWLEKYVRVEPADESLLCVSGRGWYQEWGQEARELHPGDVVNIPASVKHWHGAACDSWFQHLAIEVPGEGGKAEWLEPVDDETYGKLN